MNIKNSTDRWGALAQGFHWAVLMFFVFEYAIAQVMEHSTLGMSVKTMFMLHKSVGVLLLLVVIARVVWRMTDKPPQEVPGPAWQQSAARLTHLALYGIMVMVPFTGYVMSVAGGKEWLWFGQWVMPNVVGIDPPLKSLARKSHFFFVDVAVGLIALHVGAVVFHKLAHGVSILPRMLPDWMLRRLPQT